MTLEEAKKLLKKEGFELKKTDVVCDSLGSFTRYESADVTEAMQIVSQACYSIGMQLDEFDARKERLKKELEANTTDSSYKINPELVDASKAFNDALLDEQAKKIFKQSREIDELKMRNMALDELSASRNKITVKQSKEISKLRKVIRDKDAVLSDVSEELRLSKVREENLTEVCQKYLKEIDELKDKVGQAEQRMNDAYASCHDMKKKIDARDAEINGLEKKLKKQKDLVDDISLKYDGAKYNLWIRIDECEKLKNLLVESEKKIKVVSNSSKEYHDWGVAANEFIKKLSSIYLQAYNENRFDIGMLMRCKDYKTYGFPAIISQETKKEIDEIASGKEHLRPASEEPCGEPKKSINTGDYISKEELMKIQEEDVRKITTPPFTPISEMRKGNGILDQMVVSADLGKGESYTSSVIVIPKDADPTLLRNIFKDMTDIINSEL